MLRKGVPYLTRYQNIHKTIRNGDVSYKNIAKIPLSVPLPVDLSPTPVKSSSPKERNSRLTTLSNGLKVVTENTCGEFVTMGVAVESGCRFENGFPFGVSRVAEKLAYGKSQNYEDREQIYQLLDDNSAIVDCQSTRDTMMYATSCHRDGVDEVISIVADTVLRRVIDEQSLEMAKTTVKLENQDLPNRIETLDIILPDWIHQAAFQHNTIGIPKYGVTDLEKIRIQDVYGYLSRVNTPERMVVGGVGVDHDEFVSSVRRVFESSPPIWSSNPSVLPPKVPELDISRAQYTGGEIRLEENLRPLTVGKPYPLLAHVVLGLEGCSYKDEDFVPMCVLQSLLGGGGAFSAGGPGKGMYSRMYTEVMNRNYWIYSAIAHNHSYSDAGVFTLTASAPPENINDALTVLLHQMLILPQGVDSADLARAKTQLRSHLMMNLEVRPVLFEDMVRQVSGHGERKRPEEYAEKIEKVTNKDILRVADRLLSSKPSLVGYGELNKLAAYNQLDQAVAKRDLKYLMKN